MSIVDGFLRKYALWRKEKYKKRWLSDFDVLFRTHGTDNPFDSDGLKLALLHVQKTPIEEPSVEKRRTMSVYVVSETIDQLMQSLVISRTIVLTRDSMPEVFLKGESKLRRFDDYFISNEGHAVSIEKITRSLEGRLTQLFQALEELEVNQSPEYAYYLRKLKPLYRDVYFVLHAIHATSYL